MLEGHELVAAVGESFYQEVLLSICGARCGEPVEFDCIAVLVAEPDNSDNPNAIMVQVDAARRPSPAKTPSPTA